MYTEMKVAVLLMPHVHIMDLAGPVQVFYEAKALGKLPLTLTFVAPSENIKCEQGIDFTNLLPINNIHLTSNDFLIIPGIDFKSFLEGGLNEDLQEIRDWLSEQFKKNVKIATICSGILIPSYLNLLQNRSFTSHWKCIDYLKNTYSNSKVITDQLFVKDKNLYSSAGMTSGIDMCIAIVEELYGPVLASQIAREMVIYLRRDKDNHQESIYLDYQTHFNPGIHKVQNYIISHPDKNPSLKELAEIASMSTRNLTRTFKNLTGHTIVEFKHRVKEEFAKSLLNNPSYTMEEIASKCGYKNSRQLIRIRKKIL